MRKIILSTLKIIFINCVYINYTVEGFTPSEIIQTENGQVQGLILETITGKLKFSAFVGIPYAEPPLGRLRFQPPVPKKPWDGVLSTINQTSSCPQWAYFKNLYTGNEDCLYLNVYTPKILSNDTSLKPVMVWIHGGSFKEGSINASRYGPDFMLEENVVVVPINYRLGALGFLSLDHPDATGNAGLKDQSLALKWVKKNIQNFGGDPNLVTIFGESAGSISVQLHKLSPMSRGLFERSIAMSGSPLNFWAICVQPTAVSRALILVDQLNITSDNKTEVLEEMYKIPAETIIRATEQLGIIHTPFKPTIENPDIATDAFLSDCVVSSYEAGNFTDEPHLLGFLRAETMFFSNGLVSSVRSLEQALNRFVNLTGISTVSETVYLDGIVNALISTLVDFPYLLIHLLIYITTDLIFIAGIDRTQQYLSKGKGPVYYYRNSFDYPQARHKMIGNHLNGTAHTNDIAHIFWVRDLELNFDPKADISRHRTKMVKMWTNMAKYGNPTPKETSDSSSNLIWPISGPEGTCFEIDREFTVAPRPVDTLIWVVRILLLPFYVFLGTCNLMF